MLLRLFLVTWLAMGVLASPVFAETATVGETVMLTHNVGATIVGSTPTHCVRQAGGLHTVLLVNAQGVWTEYTAPKDSAQVSGCPPRLVCLMGATNWVGVRSATPPPEAPVVKQFSASESEPLPADCEAQGLPPTCHEE